MRSLKERFLLVFTGVVFSYAHSRWHALCTDTFLDYCYDSDRSACMHSHVHTCIRTYEYIRTDYAQGKATRQRYRKRGKLVRQHSQHVVPTRDVMVRHIFRDVEDFSMQEKRPYTSEVSMLKGPQDEPSWKQQHRPSAEEDSEASGRPAMQTSEHGGQKNPSNSFIAK